MPVDLQAAADLPAPCDQATTILEGLKEEFIHRMQKSRDRLPMQKDEILQLIDDGENSVVEFKRDDIRPEQLAKEVVALANFQGGHILVGVEDDGTITGIQRSDFEHWVMDTVFGRKVHPKIIPFYAEVNVDRQKRIAVIGLAQGVRKPYVVRHHGEEKIYIRLGSTSRLASREQQAQLFATGGMLYAELFPVSRSCLNDLSLERLADYYLNILAYPKTPESDEEWEGQLCRSGFMVESEGGPPVCTVAGLVLFGYRPRRLLRHSGVRWMAFGGTEKDYRAIDDRVIDGPLVALLKELDPGQRLVVEKGLIESLEAVMQPLISEEELDGDLFMRRERRWMYPEMALREAIVNALIHRDWARYMEIEVVRYDDRLEVVSPGTLPNSMTVDKMVAGVRVARNPIIVEVIRDYGYADARGMGVRNKIIPLMIQSTGRAPDFIATEDQFRVVMHRKSG